MKVKKTILHLIERFFAKSFGKYYENKKPKVLTYHSVCNDLKNEFAVSINQFREQMNYLYLNNYKVLRMSDLNNIILNKNFEKKSIFLTFDDGLLDNYENVLPIISKYNYYATFFVTTSFVNSRAKNLMSEGKYMSWDNLKELKKRGHEIGLHSHSHKMLSKISLVEFKHDVSEARNIFRENMGYFPKLFAYPYGKRNSFTKEIGEYLLTEGFDLIFTQINGSIKQDVIPFSVPRNNISKNDTIEDFTRKLNGNYEIFKYFIHVP